MLAYNGWARANGVDKKKKEFMSDDELRALMEKFPDAKK